MLLDQPNEDKPYAKPALRFIAAGFHLQMDRRISREGRLRNRPLLGQFRLSDESTTTLKAVVRLGANVLAGPRASGSAA